MCTVQTFLINLTHVRIMISKSPVLVIAVEGPVNVFDSNLPLLIVYRPEANTLHHQQATTKMFSIVACVSLLTIIRGELIMALLHFATLIALLRFPLKRFHASGFVNGQLSTLNYQHVVLFVVEIKAF